MARKTKSQIQAEMILQRQQEFEDFKNRYSDRLIKAVMFYAAKTGDTSMEYHSGVDFDFIKFFDDTKSHISTLPINPEFVNFDSMYELEEVEACIDRYNKKVKEQEEQQQKFNVAWNKLTAEERQLLGIRNA